jgi:hypothetical protein
MTAEPWHGGSGGGYTNHGCRCQECRDANWDRVRHRRRERRELAASGRGEFEHGMSGYTNWMCRCETCTEANRAVGIAYRQRAAS